MPFQRQFVSKKEARNIKCYNSFQLYQVADDQPENLWGLYLPGEPKKFIFHRKSWKNGWIFNNKRISGHASQTFQREV